MKLYRITQRQNKLKKTGPANRNDTRMTVRNTTQSSLSTEYRRTDTRHDLATQATPDSVRQTTSSQLGNVTDLTIRPDNFHGQTYSRRTPTARWTTQSDLNITTSRIRSQEALQPQDQCSRPSEFSSTLTIHCLTRRQYSK